MDDIITASAEVVHKFTQKSLELSKLVIYLLRNGVLYREDDENLWANLLRMRDQAQDLFSVLLLELIVDEDEGHAFLINFSSSDEEHNGQNLPRLVPRRQLSYMVSLMLALLRKRMAEFDTNSGDTKLVLSRDDIVDMISVYLPDDTNETRIINQIDAAISKIVELGFLRKIKSVSVSSGRQANDVYEVRRILKSYIDAQWLAKMDYQLESYLSALLGKNEDETTDDN